MVVREKAKSLLLQTRLLVDLVDFHLQHGARSDAYLDDETGGIYEHKLASLMGIEVENGTLPVAFLEATAHLERRGLVRRNFRRPDFPIRGIRPTKKGVGTAKKWIILRNIYRKRPAALRVYGLRIVLWFLTSVLLAGFLYALVQGLLRF